MTTKTHLIEKKNPQHNQEWEWEETPELLQALALWRSQVAKRIFVDW